MPAILNLSGAPWWRRNQSRYPNSKDLNTLDPTFREHVENFILALRGGGALVIINSTRRSPERAYLMHYAWQVAHGLIEAARVPAKPGVAIEWDHGDDKASRKGAQEMVTLAHMAFQASLTSNHTKGLAIDMDIAWKDDLFLKIPRPRVADLWKIQTTPRTGAGNRELHSVAREFFGVRKLVSDPPHWSSNGR